MLRFFKKFIAPSSETPAVEETPPQPNIPPVRMNAYDIDFLTRAAEHVSPDGDHGWVFGLPRGLKTTQWPLDPITGAPLMHGFTLFLPPDYRCHGPEIVGFSFFATPADQNDGGARPNDAFEGMIIAPENAENPPPDWRPYLEQAKGVHPATHRMTDILGYHYAVVLLTEAEINGPVTQPPDLAMLDGTRPGWMTKGAAKAYLSQPYQYSSLGSIPEEGVEWNLALRCVKRENDPNAGRTPMESWGDEPTASGYISYMDAANNYETFDWAKDHSPDHLGGTMRPIQAMPEVGLYYIGFEEYFGGYNFGGGNAQLDFENMVFDWACD